MHIYRTTQERFGFNVINIIFEEIPLTPNNRVENFIILSSKQYIFSCLFQNKIPALCGLLCHIRMKYCIERCVFMRNSKLADFDNQWLVLKKMFDSKPNNV